MVADPQCKVEHLKLAQGVILRMAGNSAQMKMWAVSLVTATYIFSGVSADPHWLVGVGGLVPVLAFWSMDARYLHLERCYRKLYEAVLAETGVAPFDLDYRPFVTSVDSVWSVARSWSVCRFYGALLAAVLALVAILFLIG